MDHITLFTTVEEYKEAKDNLLVPNISYITETDSVEYMKKHLIDFGTDSTSKVMCVSRWDTDGDGEISFEEAAAVTSIGMDFVRAAIVDGMWLRYFKGLTSLPSECFRYASGLTKIAIPKNIRSIGNNWINNASALRELYCYWDESIPSLPSGLLIAGIQKIYIPKGTYGIYSTHTRFSTVRAKLVELEKMP